MNDSSKILTALIVDDESLSREKIRNLLAPDPEIEVIGECSNGVQAVQEIHHKQPDLIFLDIQMPELDGFGVVEHMEKSQPSHIIFITAYDDYAIRAFEVNAIDYVLKPFDKARFSEAVARAKRMIQTEKLDELNTHLHDLLEALKSRTSYLKRLVIKTSGRIYFIKTEQIDWIESAGNYVVIHCGAEKHLYRETLKCLSTQLDPETFIRIHRSKIVNMERIQEIQPWSHGDHLLILEDGTELVMSRNYKDGLEKVSTL